MFDNWEARIERRRQLVRGRWVCWRGACSGARFGLGHGVRISYPGCLDVGDDVTIDDCGYLNCLSAGCVHIGSCTIISRTVWLHCGSLEDHALSWFKISDQSFICCNAVIGFRGGTKFGSYVLIGPGLTIRSENHRFDELDRLIYQQCVEPRKVLITDNCWIASHVTILAGVTIGEGCVVVVGAVVTRDVLANGVVGGILARPLRMGGYTDG